MYPLLCSWFNLLTFLKFVLLLVLCKITMILPCSAPFIIMFPFSSIFFRLIFVFVRGYFLFIYLFIFFG